jgi:hypothetical protein
VKNPWADIVAWAAGRIRAGEGVGEHYLWGQYAEEMLRRELITPQALSALRNAHWRELVKVYGRENAKTMLRRIPGYAATKGKVTDPARDDEGGEA